MTKRKPVPHEITIFALTRNDDGTKSVFDIIETSFKHAPSFLRRLESDPMCCEYFTRRPDELAAKTLGTKRKRADDQA